MTEQSKKILVVEDEPAVSLALVDALTHEGFTVMSAKDGQNGLATALAEHPDVIVSDIKMPIMTGLEMLNTLRADPWGKNAKVIILSNMSDLETLQKAMEHGAFHYMVKGDSSMADIVAAVKKQLGQ
jgi:two-component system, OmpR family, alkaline phosphatase synthesis response regulator PhoP